MHEESSAVEDLQPVVKRKKTLDDGNGHEGSEVVLPERKSTRVFLSARLADFTSKPWPCGDYLPVELGAFSFDSEGKFCNDRSQLRYYNPPSKLEPGLNLNKGYDLFQTKCSEAPSLEPILRWIALNGYCFKSRIQDLPSTSAHVDSSTTKKRPDNLHFIVCRSVLTKMLCSLYNQEPWKVLATLYKGNIYFQEIKTDKKRNEEAEITEQLKKESYWGLKFEDYVTCKEAPTNSPSQSASQVNDQGDTFNPLEKFCSVIKAKMNTHFIVMSAEVDCCDHMSKEKPPKNYIELKTSGRTRDDYDFQRYTLLKWWAQSFLVGVPKIICGFRNDKRVVQSVKSFKKAPGKSKQKHPSSETEDIYVQNYEGVVQSVVTFKTADIHTEMAPDGKSKRKRTSTKTEIWQPSTCVNFLDELLAWIRKYVVKDDPKVAYMLDWQSPYTHVTCCEHLPEYPLIPDWYIKEQQTS